MRRCFRLWPVLVLVLSISTYGQDKKPDKPTEPFRYVNPETARLEQFIGTWKVTERHFAENGKIIASATGLEEITWMLDRRAIQRSYRTSSGKTAFHAIGILTWNGAEKKYHGVWFNNTSTTGPTIVKGDWPEESATLTMELEATAGDGSRLKLKVIERHIDHDKRVRTTYSIDGDQVVKRLEVSYERTIPCPAKMRILNGPGS